MPTPLWAARAGRVNGKSLHVQKVNREINVAVNLLSGDGDLQLSKTQKFLNDSDTAILSLFVYLYVPY